MKRLLLCILLTLPAFAAFACGQTDPVSVPVTPTPLALTRQEAILGKAEELGITLSAEERAAARTQMEQDMREYGLFEDAELMESLDAEAIEKEYLAQALEERVLKAVDPQINVGPQEIETWYRERFTALDNAFKADPGVFRSQQDYFDRCGGVPPLIVPEGYVRVKQILVEDETLAGEIYRQLCQGGDFDALLAQYGRDVGMEAQPYATLGYLTSAYNSAVDLLPEIKQAALALSTVGSFTQPIHCDAGYAIVRLVERVQPKRLALEEAEPYIRTLLENQARRDAFDALVERWMLGLE